VLLAGLLLMVKQLTLDSVDRRHASRQFKKDEQFAPSLVVDRELSIGERVAILNKRYLEETSSESDFEKRVRGVIVGVDDL